MLAVMSSANFIQAKRTDKRGSVSSALFPYTVLSYQNAAGVRYTPPRRVEDL